MLAIGAWLLQNAKHADKVPPAAKTAFSVAHTAVMTALTVEQVKDNVQSAREARDSLKPVVQTGADYARRGFAATKRVMTRAEATVSDIGSQSAAS